MQLCTFVNPSGEVKVGARSGSDEVVELSNCNNMLELITADVDSIKRMIDDAAKAYSLKNIRFKPPLLKPGKLIFIGLNYREHAQESNMPLPEEPIIFSKFNNSLVGHEEEVIISRETGKCDYEVELAVVIGKKGKRIAPAKALDYIFGYTICNDISARDLQLSGGGQWLRGKSLDTFAPMGPVIVTKDELDNPHNLAVETRINGEVRQKSNTEELIFDIPYLISFLSRTMTLEPGDIISTGTPSGVAMGMDKPEWLQPGDVCELEIEKIGVLRNKMAADL